MEFAAEFGREFVNQLGDRKGFRNVSRKLAGSRQMPNEQRKDLMGSHEGAGAVDRADAVAVAIGTEARVIFACPHRLPQRFDVRLDGLGMHAA